MIVYNKKFFYLNYGNLHIVRTAYDEEKDFVNAFLCPYLAGNRNMNFIRMAMIDKTVPYEYTHTALIEAESYKDCDDDISPIRINGYFIGGNHGNPNLIDVYCRDHGRDESFIGSQVQDDSYTYTIIQVQDRNRLLLCYLNEENQSEVVRVGKVLKAEDGREIEVLDSCKHMNLNPCGNRRKYAILGDGQPAESNHFYDELTVTDEYNILDMSDIVDYLRNNRGLNTNRSYYENDIRDSLAFMRHQYTFDEKGRISEIHRIEVQKRALFEAWMGTQHLNFTRHEDSFVRVPGSESGDDWFPAKKGLLIRSAGKEYPATVYLEDPSRTKGFYIYVSPQYGSMKNVMKKNLSHIAEVSPWRTKIYFMVDERNEYVDPGFSLEIACSKGPFDPNRSVEENGSFSLNGEKHSVF